MMTGELHSRTSGRIFLVLEPQALVRIDLAEALAEICPAAKVLAAPTVVQARQLLGDLDGLTGAIVGIGVPALKESGLAGRIEALGAWIICLNGRRTGYIRAEGWHPLARPFSADDAQQLVRSLLSLQGSAPAAG